MISKCTECGTQTARHSKLCKGCEDGGMPIAVRNALEKVRFEAPMLRAWAQNRIAAGSFGMMDNQEQLAEIIWRAAYLRKDPYGDNIEKETVWVKFCQLAQLDAVKDFAKKMVGLDGEATKHLEINLKLEAVRDDPRVSQDQLDEMFGDVTDAEYTVKGEEE